MIWIIGAGLIGQEYAKILTDLKEDYKIIGRSDKRASECEDSVKHEVVRGGLELFLASNPTAADKAIVAVRPADLSNVTISLAKYGVKEILCEKPGFLKIEEIDGLMQAVKAVRAKVYIAYNRRFFASTLKAEEIIKEDGEVTSFNFEFTEWPSSVQNSGYDMETLNHWFLANTTHVVDLAFFLGGYPVDMKCYTANKLEWHSPSAFAGAGVTDKGALFSYHANWDAPGRWVVEVLTKKHRLYFKPMETLQIQEMNSVRVNPVEIDDTLDKKYKPGFYLEAKAFVEGDEARLCSLEQQVDHVKKFYSVISKAID